MYFYNNSQLNYICILFNTIVVLITASIEALACSKFSRFCFPVLRRGLCALLSFFPLFFVPTRHGGGHDDLLSWPLHPKDTIFFFLVPGEFPTVPVVTSPNVGFGQLVPYKPW